MSDETVAFGTTDAAGRRLLDVSSLPTTVFGARSPVWWGNTLLIFSESTCVAICVAAYFYLRQNFAAWPPPNPNTSPPLFHPTPDLLLPTVELAVMLASCGLMFLTDRAARAIDAARTKIGLWLLLVIVLALIVCRFYEFHGIHFRWDDNAYASIVWTLLGLHLTYLFVVSGEFLIMALWLHRARFDRHHAHDVVLAGTFWYWTVATWALLYAVVYIGARVL
jgi:cytochrome c oxidase subunit III